MPYLGAMAWKTHGPEMLLMVLSVDILATLQLEITDHLGTMAESADGQKERRKSFTLAKSSQI